ncbi:DNA replication ATP-dependent helicase/nuclease [Plasmodiophora brassicae]
MGLLDAEFDAALVALGDLELPAPCTRFLVLEAGVDSAGTVLRLFHEGHGAERVCRVRGDWRECFIDVGDYVNVIGEAGSDGEYVVDNENNMIIVHPDRLVSGTRVGSSVACMRRAVLSERVNAPSSSVKAIRGTLAHQLFQACLRSGNFSERFARDQVADVVRDAYLDLILFEETEQDTVHYLTSLIPQLQAWSSTFCGRAASADSEVHFADKRVSTRIVDVLDIEDQVLAPRYGLQGKIDATVRAECRELGPLSAAVPRVLPLELKTGKPRTADNAQLSLYTLLLSERYSPERVESGLLLYLTAQSVAMKGIVHRHGELRQLIIKRNIIASYAVGSEMHGRSGALPALIDNDHYCRNCFQADSCMLFRKAYESSDDRDPHPLDDIVGHLNENHMRYFRFWNQMIDLDSREARQRQSRIWTETSATCQAHGRCVSNVCLDSEQVIGEMFFCTFKASLDSTTNFTSLYFEEGDKVAISTEDGQVGIATGFVVNVDERSVVVRIYNRRLSVRFQHCRFRIDKDEYISRYANLRGNLVALCAQAPDSDRLRDLIVDLRSPLFDIERDLSVSDDDLRAAYFNDLNEDQRKAVRHVMATQDYALILGFPGTGKTTLIVFLVRLMVFLGQPVLLCCHTNTSLDNILQKLVPIGVPFIRLGIMNRIQRSLHDHTLEEQRFQSLQEAREFCASQPVVGCTCLGASQTMLGRRRFDWVICDEASQATEIAMLAPLRLGKRFVLVGDHYQLPPLVRDPVAKRSGMDTSLFLRLSEAHPHAVVQLKSQYRMNEAILSLSNSLIYSNALVCGTDKVASARLHLPAPKRLPRVTVPGATFDWLGRALDPERPVLFLNTDAVPAPDGHRGEQNETEAELVLALLDALSGAGVPGSHIGVISPYRSQLQLLRRRLGARRGDVEVESVDKFQGRDKDVIIMSLVRSNPKNRVGELLQDWRRINVALTRSRYKLVLVGSQTTLRHSPIMAALIDVIHRQHTVVDLPARAHLFYRQEEADEGAGAAVPQAKRLRLGPPGDG